MPDLEENGIQHPRTNGSSFPTAADEFYKTWPVLAYTPSWSEGLNVPQFVSEVEGTADPPCHPEDTRTVSWKLGTDMPQQSRQSHPSCQAPISVDLSGMEQYLKKFHANFSKLQRKVAILEQEQEEHAEKEQKIQEKLQVLMDLCDSHDVKFQHEVNNSVQFQTELREHFDDHKMFVTNEIVEISKISLRQHLVLEQQRSKGSSSSSGTGSGRKVAVSKDEKDFTSLQSLSPEEFRIANVCNVVRRHKAK